MSNIYLLNNRKFEGINNIQIINIKPIKQEIDFNNYDALVITSKYAITSLNSFSKNWKDIPIYAIAPQTAKIIKELNGNVQFTGTKTNGDDFADELLAVLKDKKVLYLRGEKQVSSLVDILNNYKILCDELVVYKSVCKKTSNIKTLPKNSIIIFPSPTTVECFFKHYKWNKSYKAVSFGKITASYLPPDVDSIINQNSSLASCIQEALKL